MSIRKASKEFGIPYNTLQEHLRENDTSKRKLGRKPIFTPEQENILLEHLNLLSEIFFGLTNNMLRRKVYEFAELNNIQHRFNRSTRIAGRYDIGFPIL